MNNILPSFGFFNLYFIACFRAAASATYSIKAHSDSPALGAAHERVLGRLVEQMSPVPICISFLKKKIYIF